MASSASRRDVHELDGAAAADLLAERAREALERALRDALAGALGLLRGGADDDDAARTSSRLRSLRGEELLELDELLGGGDAGGVEDQALVLLVRGATSLDDAMPRSSSASVRPGAETAVAADDDGAR